MLFLTNLGQGNLRPYFLLALFTFLFAFGGASEAQAQVDVTIEIIRAPAPMGESIKVNPNPVINYAQVEHEEDLQMQTLTIRNQNGTVLAVLDLAQSYNFLVSLPAELTYWVFHTDQGIISKQVVISGT